MRIRKANINELEIIVEFYKSVIGQKGCTWNELYPSNDGIINDFNHGCLYVFENEDIVTGAVSVVPENELEELKCWKYNEGIHKEIARVVISKNQQGKGLSKVMLEMLFDKLSEDGCSSIRLLVAKVNISANKLYRSLGFEFRDECRMYGNDYYVCEKCLLKK